MTLILVLVLLLVLLGGLPQLEIHRLGYGPSGVSALLLIIVVLLLLTGRL